MPTDKIVEKISASGSITAVDLQNQGKGTGNNRPKKRKKKTSAKKISDSSNLEDKVTLSYSTSDRDITYKKTK